MGISLAGTTAWRVDDRIEPGSYIVRAAAVERTESSNKNAQIQVDWRVMSSSTGDPAFKGAEQRDWITVTEASAGRVVAVIEAIGQETPQTDFSSYEELADWVAEKLKENGGAIAEVVIRWEPGRKDPSKEFPEIKGYRKPNPSDVPSDGAGFARQPGVNGAECKQEGCTEAPVKDGLCKKHELPF